MIEKKKAVEGEFVVLSLFDGMSCGQIALTELGKTPTTYYASEIDKHAIAQTQFNFPNTIQLGSVVDVDVNKLKYVNALLGGSPCQSFSFAGKRKGMATKCDVEIYTLEKYLELKEQGFEFEGQSYLFWEYMRILTDIRKYNPNVKFLLENVEMGNKWERVLSEAIGIYGVHINSALVSAQNRKRIYWTNIRTKQVGLFGELHADIPQPKDEGILLRDVLERDVPEKYYLSDKTFNYLSNRSDLKQKNGCGFKFDVKDNLESKSSSIGIKYGAGRLDDTYVKVDKQLNPKSDQEKASCFTAGAHSGGNHSDMDLICVSMVGRKLDENGTRKDNDPDIKAAQRLEPNLSGKTNCLTSVQKDNLVVCLTPKRTDYGKQIRKQYEAGEVSAMRKEVSQLEPREDGKTNTITTVQKDNLVIQLNPSKESGGVQPYQQNRVYDPNGISPCLNTDSRPHAIITPCDYRHDEGVRMKQDGKTGASTGSATDDESCGQLVKIEQRSHGFNKGGSHFEKSPTVLCSNDWAGNNVLHAESRIRRLTPTEVARLQTVPDWYIWACSDTQIYRMCGNGWTIKVIMHILSF
jgi:site-specific DNA-cytosine methylase